MILKNIYSNSACRQMLQFTRNLRKSSSSIIEQLPKTQDKIVELEKYKNKEMVYPPFKKSVMYPEPKIALLPSEIAEQEKLILERKILSSSNHDEVLSIYLKERDSFEFTHFFVSLKRLDELCSGSSILLLSLKENEIFQSLCYDIWKAVPQMDATLVLKIYKHLLNLKVQGNSLINQSLLQMARHQINHYRFSDLILLYRLLKNTDDCNLKTALQTALPKVLENSINFHVPRHLTFYEMCQLASICNTENISKLNDVIENIYTTSLPNLMKEEDDLFIRRNLVSLVNKLCDVDILPHTQSQHINVNVVKELLYYALDVLVEKDVNELGRNDLIIVLRRTGYFLAKNKNYCVVHDQFLSEASRKCLVEDWDVKSLLHVIHAQLRLNYVSDELVSLAASKLREDVLEDVKDTPFTSFLFALSASTLPKEVKMNATNFLMKNLTLPYQDQKIWWIRLALCLLNLNYFDLSILKGIIDKNFLKRCIKNKTITTYDYLDIQRLQKYLKFFEETRELNIYSEFLSQQQEIPPPELRNLLTGLLGNEDYILSNVVTPQGNYIDHVVVFEKGKLLKLNKNETSQIFNSKTETKRIAIMEVPEPMTIQPGDRVHISFKVDFELIEKEGFVILPIFEREISDLQENARDHIKKKLERFGIKNFL